MMKPCQTLRVLVFAALLAACAGEPPAPSPVVPTLAPTRTLASTSTPAPTQTPAATHTPQPTASATPIPTATQATFNPLTGLPVSDPAVLQRRPLAIKVAHFPRYVREHQAGLSFADNVWEHYAEGGVIRFTTIFLSQSPEKVGNVRSARLIDAHLAQAYQAVLVASGSSAGTLARLRDNAELYKRVIAEATGYTECPVMCREEAATVTSSKLFTSPKAVWDLAEALGLGGAQNLAGYVFSEAVPAGGTPISTVHIDFQLNNTVSEYRYDSATGEYTRWVDTAQLPELAPHVDTLTGRPLTTANVVVMYVTHVTSNIREDEAGQHFSYDILLTGSGAARLFRNGQMYEVTWTRAEAGGLPQFTDAQGRPIAFKPGNVWFAVVTPNSPTRVEGTAFFVRFKGPDPFPVSP